MGEFARAAVYAGPNQMETRDVEIPPIGPDEMLIEVLLCGVDGSELKWFKGEFDWMNQRAPVTFGDEILGRVAVVGADAAERRGLAVGDRVVVESRWPCQYGCRMCAKGQYYLCERRPLEDGYGSISHDSGMGKLWGGYATHVYVPMQAVTYRVPDQLSDEAALVGCSALANGIRWFDSTGMNPGQHVVVIGPGPQGLCTALAGVRAGSRVTIVGLEADEDRLAMARAFGAATVVFDPEADLAAEAGAIISEHGEVDAAIEVTGSVSGKRLSIALPRPAGTVVTVAASARDYPTDWRAIHLKELTIRGLLSHPHTVQRALDLTVALAEDGIDLGSWITHTFGIEEVAKALHVASYETDERPIKVALDPRR